MNLIRRLFGKKADDTHSNVSVASQASNAAHMANQREVLRIALRDCLTRHGIPQGWVGAETLPANGTRELGLHLRLLVKQWEPSLLPHLVALQRSLEQRIVLIDPRATGWLAGFSWQFALADETACPALPQPAFWTAPPAVRAEATRPAYGITASGGLHPEFDESDDDEDERDHRHSNFRPTEPIGLH